MRHKILFVERKSFESVSIERAFRQIAANLSDDFEAEFQQLPYGNRFWDTLRNLFFFRKNKADIYHITGHIHYIALLFSPKNTVLSIMDVRFLYIKHGLRRWLLKKLYLDWPLKKLKFVTAISRKTRDEIVKYNGCDTAKVTVLDLPLVIYPATRSVKGFDQLKPVILQVGTMENKNIPNLAKALSGINCKLRIIGKLTPAQIAILNENEIDFDYAFDLTGEQLVSEYEAADMVAFCSIYEGFGLPIIEAQAMRKPVITSNVSPMNEVAGDAAYLADPNIPQSIREGVLKMIGDQIYREKLVEAGLINIRRFDPALVVKKYEEIYRKMLSGNGNEIN